MTAKSTVAEIRARFDGDVERFANLETGQSATMDAVLALDMVARTAAAAAPPAAFRVLDLGCGAGNFTLKLRQIAPQFTHLTLCDLSAPMLARATDRLSASPDVVVETVQADLRSVDWGENRFDVVLAAAVLHHLRTEDEWHAAFSALHRALSPGGGLWIFDLVAHEVPAVQAEQWARYGDYLTAFKGEAYRDTVFAYIEREDTPRPLTFQIDALRRAGFAHIDVLHKNGPFAAFGGIT